MLSEPCAGYGMKIQELREKIGMTRSELALMTETNETMVINLENSKSHPTDQFIAKVAAALNMNPYELKKYIWCDQDTEECRTTL